MTTAFDLHFDEVNAAALKLFPGLLYQWFPGGVMHGDEYDVLNPLRNDRSRGSFRINVTSGEWGDFATDMKGKSPISLYAQFFCSGNNPDEARKAFLELFLFGWRAPFSQVTGRQTQINPDNLVNRDIAGNCGIEWGFLLGLADAALGVQTEGV